MHNYVLKSIPLVPLCPCLLLVVADARLSMKAYTLSASTVVVMGIKLSAKIILFWRYLSMEKDFLMQMFRLKTKPLVLQKKMRNLENA